MKAAELAEKAAGGDDEAFLELIGLHKIKLYKIAFSYLKNQNDALEAVQETTFRAYRSIGTLRQPQFVSTWLVRILINYCSSHLRMNKNLVSGERLGDLPSGQSGSASLELQEAIQGLEEKQREIIMLRYFHDMKIKDIADVLQCPEGTAKTWLTKALQSLRRMMKKGGAWDV
ncbi:sigma-70 family RNA polymerase sigma factor [Peribacillus kribbensis]|uniref:sigma-70 family RNA polymerase sigma factor n=1 Tax=Peribacillus kribbensis TaxID=356658 RepID=UPI000426C72E|nr:sigma-70 family RNA polymerase sigma factor [Peribacillus kribbensis]